ncbi:hypothetical protein BD410DRAFT_257223 [Rickenella mellea]|uniref:F-box domain-containing protein n=1 Tax=Rickenella mellea TaxID=50990 RepID=A0A4Y7Q411_9AGAM|nr:hypothetical protein BD410DRAFT_257223 [Rickenella mellea]
MRISQVAPARRRFSRSTAVAKTYSLPTELWRIIIRLAAHFPMEFDFTSDDEWENTIIADYKNTMPTKLVLLRVCRLFNEIVNEFFFDVLYISSTDSALRFTKSVIYGQYDDETWRKALAKFVPGQSSRTVTTPRTATIRYFYIRAEWYSNGADFAYTIANILKADCCRNLEGFFNSNVPISYEPQNAYGMQNMIDAIPSGIRSISWIAGINVGELSALLHRVSKSLKAMRICPDRFQRIWDPRGPLAITFPVLTQYALTGGMTSSSSEVIGGWKMPSLTHLIIGKSVLPTAQQITHITGAAQNTQRLSIHLRSLHNSRVRRDSDSDSRLFRANLKSMSVTCHRWTYSFDSICSLLRDYVEGVHRPAFPELEVVEVFGVGTCMALAWRSKSVDDIQALFRKTSDELSVPGIPVRIMS